MENGAGDRTGEARWVGKNLYRICAECSRRKEPSGEFKFKSLNGPLEGLSATKKAPASLPEP
jgi:hypothetical protein